MKKLFCLIIAALLIFSFSACTNTPDTSSSSAQKPDEPGKITEVDYPTDGYDFT